VWARVDQGVFNRDVGGGGRGDSPRVRDTRVLDSSSPRAANTSRSMICQPRRPNTSESGTLFLSYHSY